MKDIFNKINSNVNLKIALIRGIIGIWDIINYEIIWLFGIL